MEFCKTAAGFPGSSGHKTNKYMGTARDSVKSHTSKIIKFVWACIVVVLSREEVVVLILRDMTGMVAEDGHT